MEPISLSEVREAVRGTLVPEDASAQRVVGISTDTRSIGRGELFVPLKGDNFDGHAFIHQALAGGAAAYLTEEAPPETTRTTAPAVCVESTISAFMNLARYYRSKYDPVTVGVTGTNGKTTTKELLGRVLSRAGPTVYSERSFNNFVGLPKTVFRLDGNTRYAVFEMGTNRPGEISALAAVAAPEVGIVTNIGASHLEGLEDEEGVALEKSSLLAGLRGRRLAVLNRDDPFYDRLAEAAAGPVVTFGICRRADYPATRIRMDFEGVSFEVKGHRLHLPLLGLHNIYNALAVYACASELGVHAEEIEAVFEGFEAPPMRLKPVRQGSLLVIDDAYNANPGSMESAVKTFSVLPVPGRKVLVLGDMLELGGRSLELHRRVGAQLSCGDFDLVVAVGERAREYLLGAMERGVPEDRLVGFEDAARAAESLPGLLKRDDAVLIKGSRKMGLERIVDALLALDL